MEIKEDCIRAINELLAVLRYAIRCETFLNLLKYILKRSQEASWRSGWRV